MSYTPKRETVEIAVVLIGTIIAVIIMALILPTRQEKDGVWIDCTWSEISPDIPVKIKEACRKLRAENILQKPK
jgi:hypothetical protein